jgi:CRISPR-associated protein Csb2
MPQRLCLSVHFPGGLFHGRAEDGRPEWPPSPLRLFQALVAAAARCRPAAAAPPFEAALTWLEQLPPPQIVAPAVHVGQPYRLSVPNNAMDRVARAWARGKLSSTGDANPATHRTMKTVRPQHLARDATVHYLWTLPDPLPDQFPAHFAALDTAARHLVVLGWGIDLVAGQARVLGPGEEDQLSGQRWLPTPDFDTNLLRIPISGTLQALADRYQAFCQRLPPGDALRPVPPLSTFATVGYCRDLEPPPRPLAAFALLWPDASRWRAFHPLRSTRRLVGMLRDAVARAAQAAGWPPEKIASFVLGHSEQPGEPHRAVRSARLAYLPLPSLQPRGDTSALSVGAARRILLFPSGPGCHREIAWARRALAGCELVDQHTGQPQALLAPLARSDRVLKNYVRRASAWATVTPVVLPGYDDHDGQKTESLLRKAIRQAGFSESLARHAELDWRPAGYWPGADLALRYAVPDYLRAYPRYHVLIRWRDERGQPVALPGPICLGGGRFVGLGLFAPQDEWLP